MFTTFKPEVPTTKVYLDQILDSVPCRKHNASQEMACWVIETTSGNFLRGVCNKRAKRAGINGQIDDRSLQRTQVRR